MRLDLEEMEQFPTNKIEGFRERIETMFPSLSIVVLKDVVADFFLE
jgi:hypothetical protein